MEDPADLVLSSKGRAKPEKRSRSPSESPSRPQPMSTSSIAQQFGSKNPVVADAVPAKKVACLDAPPNDEKCVNFVLFAMNPGNVRDRDRIFAFIKDMQALGYDVQHVVTVSQGIARDPSSQGNDEMAIPGFVGTMTHLECDFNSSRGFKTVLDKAAKLGFFLNQEAATFLTVDPVYLVPMYLRPNVSVNGYGCDWYNKAGLIRDFIAKHSLEDCKILLTMPDCVPQGSAEHGLVRQHTDAAVARSKPSTVGVSSGLTVFSVVDPWIAHSLGYLCENCNKILETATMNPSSVHIERRRIGEVIQYSVGADWTGGSFFKRLLDRMEEIHKDIACILAVLDS